MARFNLLSFLGNPSCYSLFKNISLELRATARKERIVSAPAALICPKSTRGKAPWSFSRHYLSDLALPFSLRNHRRTQKKQRSATTKKRKHNAGTRRRPKNICVRSVDMSRMTMFSGAVGCRCIRRSPQSKRNAR